MSLPPSPPEAGPSTMPTSDAAMSSEPPSTSTSSSSRKNRRPAARGVSLGLEEEVDFGSDEDLMENIGEIDVPVTNTWYPGRPDSPKNKKGKGLPTIGESTVYGSKSSLASSSSASARSRSGFMGRKDKDKTRGLADARLVIPEDFVAMSPSSSTELGASGRNSRDTSAMSASTSSGSLKVGLTKDKNKSKVFGKLFGKKKDDENVSSAGGTSMASDSVESFGSGSRYSETSVPRSILVTSAHAPPTHTPRSQASSDAPSTKLPSIPTTPFSFDSRSLPLHRQGTHSKQASGSSIVPLIHAMELPGTTDIQEQNAPGALAAPALLHSNTLTSDVTSVKRERSKSESVFSSLALRQTQSQQAPPPPSAFSQPSKPLEPSFRNERSNLTDILLPPFPTSESVLETITILSANVMRRIPAAQSSPDKRGKSFRPGTASSIATTFGGSPRKAMWQTHQLVLTSFRINAASPYSSPDLGHHEGNPNHQRQMSTQTIAHLHLFAYDTGSKSSSRPGSATPNKKRLGSLEGAAKIEIGRQAISPTTTAGVWESSDEAEADTLGRKWILRVRFSEDQEEWLCDMPTGDTLFEWVRQIKAYATVVKAETLGFGAAIRSAHSLGSTDLNLELELHEQGLKSTPRPPHSAVLPPSSANIDNVAFSPDFDQDLATPNAADAYRAAMIAQGHAYDSPSAQPPISMHDFFMRKSLSPKGQDLATFLDHADVEWRMRQAEKIRETRALNQASSRAQGENTDRNDPVEPNVRPKAFGASGLGLPLLPPPQSRPPPVPAPFVRSLSNLSSNSQTPPVPPPSMPLPATPLPPRIDSLGISVDDDTSPISPSGIITAQPMPELGQVIQSSGPKSLPSHFVTAMEGMSLREAGPLTQEGNDDLQPPPPLGRSLTSDSISGQIGDDAASISSRGSSSVIRRGGARRPQAAMDLMAELSGRREMNYEKPEELKEDTMPIDENRPRKIRFG